LYAQVDSIRALCDGRCYIAKGSAIDDTQGQASWTGGDLDNVFIAGAPCKFLQKVNGHSMSTVLAPHVVANSQWFQLVCT